MSTEALFMRELTVHWRIVALALEQPVDGCLRPGSGGDALKGGRLAHLEGTVVAAHLSDHDLFWFHCECMLRLFVELEFRIWMIPFG